MRVPAQHIISADGFSLFICLIIGIIGMIIVLAVETRFNYELI